LHWERIFRLPLKLPAEITFKITRRNYSQFLPLPPDLKNEVTMNALAPYAIPIQGFKLGVHHLQYTIDGSFLRLFEESPVEDCNIRIELQLEKRADMLLLDFELEGTVKAICDRCTALIDMPVADVRQLIVKYGNEEEDEEDEVVFISRETSIFNVAKYLYEFTVLALPITNIFDCENTAEPPCNRDILKFLEQESEEQNTHSVWDTLKDFNNN